VLTPRRKVPHVNGANLALVPRLEATNGAIDTRRQDALSVHAQHSASVSSAAASVAPPVIVVKRKFTAPNTSVNEKLVSFAFV
jgi:hypothetical protein